MSQNVKFKIYNSLRPIAWLYGCAINLRNWMFDVDILHSRKFEKTVISIGNLSVGGTGKTPHTEYMIRMLQELGYKVATLSRGYKRKTKGYREVVEGESAETVGDEPLQMAMSFPKALVAVCEDRCLGVENIGDRADVVILDDAYQHRYIHPKLNILLIDYTRPAYYDKLLPAGRLREHFKGKKRADVVIITKCPKNLTPIDIRVVRQNVQLMPWQKLFFTSLRYSNPTALFDEAKRGPYIKLNTLYTIEHTLLITGIGHPEQMLDDMQHYCGKIKALHFRDHHAFDENDAAMISEVYHRLPATDKLILTTTKDAMRLIPIADKLSLKVRQNIYVLPVKIEFMFGQSDEFKQIILDTINK